MIAGVIKRGRFWLLLIAWDKLSGIASVCQGIWCARMKLVTSETQCCIVGACGDEVKPSVYHCGIGTDCGQYSSSYGKLV